MSIAEFPKTTDRVSPQYQKFPYPLRDPEDERRLIYATPLDDLGALNFYCYRDRRDFRQGFRALVARSGTGDAVMHLAE